MKRSKLEKRLNCKEIRLFVCSIQNSKVLTFSNVTHFRRLIYSLLCLIGIGLFVRCENTQPIKPYSFIVAGHTYGNPGEPQYGLYPPFIQHTDYFNQLSNLSFGILTGDVVYQPNQAYWDAARADIAKFDFPIHIAAGNHDRGPIFDAHYPSYQAFTHQQDLFIILSPTQWNIEGAQLEFLKKTLVKHQKKVHHIFIFLHELVWWSPDNQFREIKINYTPHYPGSTNFWQEIHPLLKRLSNKVYLFAGDLGATPLVDTYMFQKENNLTYIANGMGNKLKDFVVLVKIDAEKVINFELLDLNHKEPIIVAPSIFSK